MVVNVFLFDDFEAMDVFGPVQIFGTVPEHFYIRFISLRGGIITGKEGVKIWTEPLNPIEIEDIFLIPGGKGVRSFLHTEGAKGQQVLKRAVEEGISVEGYFHWTLTDNFEWTSGYNNRFGLVYTDFKNQNRIIKDSGKWYRQVIETNGEIIK